MSAKPLNSPTLRCALPEDARKIVDLYLHVYAGKYTDPLMADAIALKQALSTSEYRWMVAESEGHIVASVVFRLDVENALAKVYAAVVDPEFRGHDLTERLMSLGQTSLLGQASLLGQDHRAEPLQDPSIEVIYATTRTVSPAPQRLTANLGYKKIGIFPNVHKTEGYETHALTALFTQSALKRRFTDFALHPAVTPLYDIVSRECLLPPLPTARPQELALACVDLGKASKSLHLEKIDAPEFVKHHFNKEKAEHEHHWFFPFHEPNLMFTNADQSVEVFCYFCHKDQHCVIIGIRDFCEIGYSTILESTSKMLRNAGARYIEFIMRSDDLRNIEQAVRSEFIPCGYFPAMHRCGSRRFDFTVFSRSFEILSFQNLALEGLNRQFVLQYFRRWKEQALANLELEHETVTGG